MTMGEWYCEYEYYADKYGIGGTFAGKLTQADVDDLLDDLELTDEEWREKNGTSTGRR